MARILFGGVSVALSLALWTAAAQTPTAGGNRIASISQDCADPGDRVSLTGIGFGALNARVAVGGIPAQIIKASGHALTFVMPAGVPAGPTTVMLAHKEGLQSGTVPLVSICRPRAGVLLEGSPTSPALAAVRDYTLGTGVPALEVSVDAAGLRVPRTRIEVAFVPAATVAQVNEVLLAIDGRITSMLANVLRLVVDIPDPGSIAGLDAVIARAAAFAVVRSASRVEFSSTEALPPSITTDPAQLSRIDHQLAIRGHAAWNARQALKSPAAKAPTLVIADFFGNEVNSAAYDVITTSNDFSTGTLDDHGFHVLGIVAGSFGGEGPTGNVTGIFPDTTVLRVVDSKLTSTTQLDMPTVENLALERIRSVPAGIGVVLNTSITHPCKTPAELTTWCTEANATQSAKRWIEKVRGTAALYGGAPTASLEHRFLHLTAAGNAISEPEPTRLRSEFASPFTAAARLPIAGIAPLTNVLVVENRANAAEPPFTPGCLSASSKRPGDISGIGEDVWSMTSNGTADDLSGTSMATPQVAGVAAYVWALEPSLTPQQLRARLRDTATPADTCAPADATPAPGVDAYAAVLSTDKTLANAPVRRALLDVDSAQLDGKGDGRFDEYDLLNFVDAFTNAKGALDFSRHDLNGDGRTGARARASFDLDADGSLGELPLTIEGTLIAFREARLSDLDILCYYAYSGALYVGDVAERQALLGLRCQGISAAGGVYTNALAATPGTSFLLKLRKEDGSPVTGAVTAEIVGPDTWGGSAGPVRSAFYAAGLRRQWYTLDTPPVSGTYVVRAQIDGIEVSTDLEIDATSTLPGIGSVNAALVSSTEVEATWTDVAPAQSFLARVVDVTGGGFAIKGVQFVEEPGARIGNLGLQAGRDYRLQAFAFSADMVPLDPRLPRQFNVAFNRAILDVGLTINPGAVSLGAGQSVALTAVYPPTITDRRTTWTATAGTVVSTGANTATYTAPGVGGTYYVNARSVAVDGLTARARASVALQCGTETARERWDGTWRAVQVLGTHGSFCSSPAVQNYLKDVRFTVNAGNADFLGTDLPDVLAGIEGNLTGHGYSYVCASFGTQAPYFAPAVALFGDVNQRDAEGRPVPLGSELVLAPPGYTGGTGVCYVGAYVEKVP